MNDLSALSFRVASSERVVKVCSSYVLMNILLRTGYVLMKTLVRTAFSIIFYHHSFLSIRYVAPILVLCLSLNSFSYRVESIII